MMKNGATKVAETSTKWVSSTSSFFCSNDGEGKKVIYLYYKDVTLSIREKIVVAMIHCLCLLIDGGLVEVQEL